MSTAEYDVIPSRRGYREVSFPSSGTMSLGTEPPVTNGRPESHYQMTNACYGTSTYGYALNLEAPLKYRGIATYPLLVSPVIQYRDGGAKRAHEAVDELIAPLPMGAQISPRLHDLIDMARDDYPETNVPSYAAFASLVRFLAGFPAVSVPSISLLPSGAIWLSWKGAVGRAGLSIFRDGTASFGLLLTSRRRPSHVNYSGPVDAVIYRIVRDNDAQWIRRG